MEFKPIERDPSQSHMVLTVAQVAAMCERAFGAEVQIASARELAGGTYNTTFVIALKDGAKAILRVAPPATTGVFWAHTDLMRREHHVQPYFAPLATLMPRTILADFTHQIVGRDYVVQSYIPGDRWDNIVDDLTPSENLVLWHQLGYIVKLMHATTGETFGWPSPGPRFATWSELLLARFERIRSSWRQAQFDMVDLIAIVDAIQSCAGLFDEIKVPRLLHGDLWLFNILVTCNEDGPRITGILDADRAWWGDPMADWLMFLLAIRRDEPQWQAAQSAFWAAYGEPEQSTADRFREEAYKALHVSQMVALGVQSQQPHMIERGHRELHEMAQTIPMLAKNAHTL